MKRKTFRGIMATMILSIAMVIPGMPDEIVEEYAEEFVEVITEEAAEVATQEATEDGATLLEEQERINEAVAEGNFEVDEPNIDAKADMATEDGAAIVSEMTLEFNKTYDVHDIPEAGKFFKVSLPATGTVTVKGHTNSVSYSWNHIDYTITDAAGKELRNEGAKAGADCMYNVNLLAGDYYLFLHTDGIVVVGDATISLSFEAVEETVADSILEPHDSVIDPIKYQGGLFKGFLARNDHKDVFEVQVANDANITIKYASADMGEINISVIDNSGTTVFKTEGNVGSLGVGAHNFSQYVSAGKCYIVIYAYDQGHQGGAYQLTVTQAQAQDEWIKTAQGWKCKLKSGEYCTTGFYTINNVKYYFYDGIMWTGWYQDEYGSYYYFDNSGAMAVSKWVGNYYLESDGKMAVDKWVDGGKYYVDASGKWVPGKKKNDQPSKVTAGWKKDGKGWWYQNSDGSYPKNCWAKISGKWYHFNKSGYMQTGWIMDGNNWYYLNSSGAMATGWVKVSGKYYYLKSSGAMAKDEWIGNYHVNGSGVWDKTK